MASEQAVRARIREIIRLRNPGVYVRSEEGKAGKVEPVAEGGFLPLLPLLASTLAPAVGSLVKFGVDKLTGNGMPKAKRAPSQWVKFAKWYMDKKGCKYAVALKEAGPHWRAKDSLVEEFMGVTAVKQRKPRTKKSVA